MNGCFWKHLAILALSCALQIATAQDIDTFYLLHDLIRDNIAGNDLKTIVRLAFHDAMGGVDGRLNEADSEHNGLLTVLGQLSNLHDANSASKFSIVSCFWSLVYVLI